MYHSVALLLPNGKVFVAGGADPNPQPLPNRGERVLPWPAGWGGPVDVDPADFNPRDYSAYAINAAINLGYTGMALNNKTFEFYEPPYCFKGPRPTITEVKRNGNVTRRIEYGQTFQILTAQATSIDINKVSFMRPGAPTHHTDTEQRYVRLKCTKGAGQLDVTAVDDPKIAPPGYYMLWIVDDQGRPCEDAVFIQLVPHGSSCVIATAALGSSDHPGVVFLQDLRSEISEATSFGRLFIRIVNRAYESFSPPIARYLENHDTVRAAVRDCIVRPVVRIIASTNRFCCRIFGKRRRYAALLSLLATEGILGLVSTPILLSVLGLRLFVQMVGGSHSETGNHEVDHASK